MVNFTLHCITFSSGIHYILIVKIKEKAAHVFVINFSSSVCLILRDYLTAVFRDELILICKVLDKNSPPRNIGWSHEKFFAKPSLNHHISTRYLGDIILVSPTC